MTSPSDLTSAAMDAAFAADQLITVPESDLDAVHDADARAALHSLRMPRFPNLWFSTDARIGAGFTRVGQFLDWDLADRYDDVPSGADQWIRLGAIDYEGIALDPETGSVHCLPQDAEIYALNSALRHFIHFLYVLQVERPNYDQEWEGEAEADPEGARRRVEAAMRFVDPAALEQPASLWFRVLESIENAEADYQ